MSIAGVAILSKLKPLNITKTLPGHPDSSIVKGRIITLEFENYYLIGTYVVNAGMGLKVIHLCMLLSAFSFYLRFSDTRTKERMEHSLWSVHPGTGQKETSDLDRRSQCSPHRIRCGWHWSRTISFTYARPGHLYPRSQQCQEKLEQNTWIYRSRNDLFQEYTYSTDRFGEFKVRRCMAPVSSNR